MTPKEITDINGKKVEVGHIVRMYTELFTVVLDEGMLKGVKLSDHSRVIYLPNYNRHIEIVACTLDYTDLQLKEERERAGKMREALEETENTVRDIDLELDFADFNDSQKIKHINSIIRKHYKQEVK